MAGRSFAASNEGASDGGRRPIVADYLFLRLVNQYTSVKSTRFCSMIWPILHINVSKDPSFSTTAEDHDQYISSGPTFGKILGKPRASSGWRIGGWKLSVYYLRKPHANHEGNDYIHASFCHGVWLQVDIGDEDVYHLRAAIHGDRA